MCKRTIKTEVIKKAEQRTAEWSGGITTELGIWPNGADYKERRFDWRISTARVDLEESTFTSLPGVHRILMLIEGKIHLVHEGIRELDMSPFSTAEKFEGSWTTKSQGRCVDFNLMTSDKYKGSMEALPAAAAGIKLFENKAEESWETFYALADNIALTVKTGSGEETLILDRGDFLKIYKDSQAKDESFLIVHEPYDRVVFVRTTVTSSL